MKQLPKVDFTKSGWRQFGKMNRCLGSRFIKGFLLRRELAEYIAAHDASAVHLDTVCQEVRYEDGVYLLMMKCQGVWYITDIWSTEVPNDFRPVFFWMKLKQGWKEFLVRVIIGWRNCVKPTALESEVTLECR